MEKVDKYIRLLLDRCLVIKDSLFISYEAKANQEFVNKLVEYAKEKGIKDIYLCDERSYEKRDILKNKSLNEIKEDKIFNNEIWDIYAKKDAAFLMIESELPGLMEGIDSEKIALSKKIQIETKPIYRQKQCVNDISWCICAYPNDVWARELFPNDDNAYNKLLEAILDMCMCDKIDPIKSWNDYLKEMEININKLNNLKINKLHYSNSLGTDLCIELPDKTIWCGASNEKNMLVNMPSYEIFTSPYNIKTEGIVYASKPLIYNNYEIKDFWLKFQNGRVIDYDAKAGKDILKGIIESDENSSMLGECALVSYHSPISNLGLTFKTTLFDENASCHIALGEGFPECYEDGLNMKEDELFKKGINKSKNHVDFMIGTKDLKIEAETEEGIVVIMENGDLTI